MAIVVGMPKGLKPTFVVDCGAHSARMLLPRRLSSRIRCRRRSSSFAGRVGGVHAALVLDPKARPLQRSARDPSLRPSAPLGALHRWPPCSLPLRAVIEEVLLRAAMKTPCIAIGHLLADRLRCLVLRLHPGLHLRLGLSRLLASSLALVGLFSVSTTSAPTGVRPLVRRGGVAKRGEEWRHGRSRSQGRRTQGLNLRFVPATPLQLNLTASPMVRQRPMQKNRTWTPP